MTYRIRQVNGKSKRTQQVLTKLHKLTLPYDKMVDTSIGYWWIIYSDSGKPVAFAGMKQSSQFTDCCYFHRSGVLVEHRGQGLQKRLARARLRKAKHMGFNWAVTDTTNNPASANSLIHIGFRMYEPSKPWAYPESCYWRYRI